MSKKRLLFVVNVDWAFISHRLPIAIEAIKQGYEVHLACSITDRRAFLERKGISVHSISLSRSGSNLLKEIRVVAELYSIIKLLRPDIVHTVTIKPVLYGGIVSRILKVPSVVAAVSGLGFVFVSKGFKASLLRLPVKLLYRYVFAKKNLKVIFQNEDDRDSFVKTGALLISKSTLIRGSGVDLSQYKIEKEPDGEPIVVMASRLLKDKGVFEFVCATKKLKEDGVVAKFLLVGEPDLGNPESLSVSDIDKIRDEGEVEVLGFRKDIPELFRKSNIVVLPSYREGLPKVLVEAAAAGRAVITTNVPGCRDAIEPNVSGILVKVKDFNALANAIKFLIEDENARVNMGLCGHALAEKEFSIINIVDAHLRIYSSLIDASKRL